MSTLAMLITRNYMRRRRMGKPHFRLHVGHVGTPRGVQVWWVSWGIEIYKGSGKYRTGARVRPAAAVHDATLSERLGWYNRFV